MTPFLQVKDNAKSIAPADSLSNTTANITVSGFDTTSFPEVTTGFAVTIWDDVNYLDPGDDPNMEKALVTAADIAEDGSLTLVRGQAKVHIGSPRIALLALAQHISDITGALNALEIDVDTNLSLYTAHPRHVTIDTDDVEVGTKNAVVIELENGRLVAGEYNGARLYTSDDGGATWTERRSVVSANAAVRALYQFSNGHIYASSGYAQGVAKVARSTDGGNTWTDVLVTSAYASPVPNAIWYMVEDADGHIYAQAYSYGDQPSVTGWLAYHIYRSTDGGATWAIWYTHPYTGTPGDNPTDIRHLHLLAINSDGQMYTAGAHAILSQTADPSGTWLLNANGTQGAVIQPQGIGGGMTAYVQADDGSEYFGSDRQNGVFKLEGGVFVNVLDFADYGLEKSQILAMAKGNEGILYALDNVYGYLWASINNGKTWIHLAWEEGFNPGRPTFIKVGTDRLYLDRSSDATYFSIPNYTKKEIVAKFPSAFTLAGDPEDVDLTNLSQAVGDSLTWNGEKWVPQSPYSANAEIMSVAATATFSDDAVTGRKRNILNYTGTGASSITIGHDPTLASNKGRQLQIYNSASNPNSINVLGADGGTFTMAPGSAALLVCNGTVWLPFLKSGANKTDLITATKSGFRSMIAAGSAVNLDTLTESGQYYVVSSATGKAPAGYDSWRAAIEVFRPNGFANDAIYTVQIYRLLYLNSSNTETGTWQRRQLNGVWGAWVKADENGAWVTVPASATAAGTAGQKAYDANYIYICTATNTWKRVAIASW